jgi:hypothetical protein
MKPILLSVCIFVANLQVFAIVRTVNNINGIDADYATMTSAINASQAGDTIYVMPSPITYGNFTLSKQLFILGAGHNPEYTAYKAFCGTITLSITSTGSVIKGLQIGVLTADNNVINNVVIANNYFNGSAPLGFASGGTYNNWIFEGNVITSSGANFINFLG